MAIAVILCSLVLLGALTVALSGYRLKKPQRTLQIDYADVTGIHLASELRYAGAPAGHVIGIRLLTSEERKADTQVKRGSANAVRITVEVNNDVPQIPDDARASINSDTLLSEKFISLSAGSPVGTDLGDKKVQELANNAVLQGYPGGLDALLNGDGLGDLLASAQGLIEKVQSLMGDLHTNVVPGVDSLLKSAQKDIDQLGPLLININDIVSDKGDLRPAIDKLQGIETDLDAVLKKADSLVGNVNGELDGRMKQIKVVLDDLKVAMTYVKSFTKQIAEKPNRVIFTTKSEKQPTEEDILKNPKAGPNPTPRSSPSTGPR